MALKTEADYRALQAGLVAIEKARGLALANESVDLENVGPCPALADQASDAAFEASRVARAVWWDDLYRSAAMAAGAAAEDAGENINALLGLEVY